MGREARERGEGAGGAGGEDSPEAGAGRPGAGPDKRCPKGKRGWWRRRIGRARRAELPLDVSATPTAVR